MSVSGLPRLIRRPYDPLDMSLQLTLWDLAILDQQLLRAFAQFQYGNVEALLVLLATTRVLGTRQDVVVHGEQRFQPPDMDDSGLLCDMAAVATHMCILLGRARIGFRGRRWMLAPSPKPFQLNAGSPYAFSTARVLSLRLRCRLDCDQV